jgi:hypothetical protein
MATGDAHAAHLTVKIAHGRGTAGRLVYEAFASDMIERLLMTGMFNFCRFYFRHTEHSYEICEKLHHTKLSHCVVYY